MSLDKAIKYGKEKRKPYRGAKACDPTCRNNGGCDMCRKNRQHNTTKKLKEWNLPLKKFGKIHFPTNLKVDF